MRTFVLGFFLLLGAAAQSCNFPLRKIVPMSAVQSCVQTIGTTAAMKQQTIDSVQKSMYLYAFRDIVKAPPESPLIHISVDVSQRLSAIAAAPISSDWQLHQAINNVFIDLHDPHTVYIKPSLCYDFVMLLPFSLSSRIDPSSGAQVVFVNGVFSLFPDPTWRKYIGMDVVSIDGVDGLTELSNFAFAKTYISKDPSTAFNSAIQTGYVQRWGGIYDFPNSPNTTWILSKPGSNQNVTVTLQWQALPLSSLSITPSTCTPHNAAQHEQAKRDAERKKRTTQLPAWRRGLPIPHDMLFGLQSALKPDISFVNISSNTMLLTISTFEPPDPNAFMHTLADGINFATKNNITQLIIDTSGNGGGDICLGYAVITQLLIEIHPVGSYDMIHSPLSASLANAAAATGLPSLWGPGQWNTLRNRVFNSSDWYWGIEGAKYLYQRGGVFSQYSSPMEIACPPPPQKIDSSVFQKAIVMTDGLCGSTCAVFVSHISSVNHVTSVVTGGLAATSKQMLWSFPGGLVYNLNSLLQDVQALNMTNFPYVPLPLPGGGQLTFALLEIYDWATADWSVPLEFLFHPAEHVLPNWCSDDSCRPVLYKQVEALFATVQ